MKQLGTVFRFEYCEYLKNKAFRIVSILGVVFIAVVLSLPSIIGMISQGNPSETDQLPSIAIVQNENIYPQETLLASFSSIAFPILLEEPLSEPTEQSEYDAVISVTAPDQFEIYVEDSLFSSFPDELSTVCNTLYQGYILQQAGLSPQQADEVFSHTASISIQNSNSNFDIGSFFFVYLMSILLFICIMLYGQFVATSVAGEKSTRTMEVLITYANPTNLIFGKIFGACAAALTQLFCFAATAGITIAINRSSYQPLTFLLPFFAQSIQLLLDWLLFFLFGFLSFAFLFGAIGSLVSRIEDLNTISMPVVLLALFVFFGGIHTMYQPDAVSSIVLSFLPFFSSISMFARICIGTPASWEILLAILINLLTIFGTGYIGVKIYRTGVLLYGMTPSPRSIWKMWRH